MPICFDTVMAVWITGMEVLSARTTSTNRMTLAGLKKCMPITDSGREVAVAISSMSSALVLVARIAPGLQIASSREKTSFLMSIRSNTASMTRSTSARSARSSVGVIRAIRSSTSASLNRPRFALRS